MSKKQDILDRFKTEEKEIHVEAWGTDVTIRRLTIEERQRVEEAMMGDATVSDSVDGKVAVKVTDLNASVYLAVSAALVQPRFKVAELKALSEDARPGINEIHRALEAWDQPGKPTPSSSELPKPSEKASKK